MANTPTRQQVEATFGHRLRVRVCGICIHQHKLLLVRHQALGPAGYLWAPPGGGMEYGHSAEENLKREFLEETGLEITVERFLFVHEYLDVPLHATELFFEVRITGGQLKIGQDPEMEHSGQIIERVQWMNAQDLLREGKHPLHYVLQQIEAPEQLLTMRGYFKFHENSLK